MSNDDVLVRIEAKLDQLLRLLALQASKELKQNQAIELLNGAGFERKIIAELLGTTPNTVSVTLSTSKAKRRNTRLDETKGETSHAK